MYDLHLTVLMRGARGSGKRTIVRSIARKTGFHLLEVFPRRFPPFEHRTDADWGQLDCFDLLGETELKTEGHLRAKIDRAITCSPCLLLLRNIEALARKSQALETGQGEYHPPIHEWMYPDDGGAQNLPCRRFSENASRRLGRVGSRLVSLSSSSLRHAMSTRSPRLC
jgi:hypothetical protein